MTPREKALLRSLLRTTTPVEAAGVVGVTANTARTLKRQWGIKRARLGATPLAMPSEPLGALRNRLGFATIEPVIRDLCTAYEDGKSARRRWGIGAHCPYKGEYADAWHLGYEAEDK